MLGTETTPYDLRFRFLDVPVRVHPLFWLITAVLGFVPHQLLFVALWILCAFVSILVHEFGHALMAKRFHGSPSILLYGLGGLCASSGERTDGQRIAVLLAGPGAGFALGGLVMLITSAFFGITAQEHVAIAGSMLGLDLNAIAGLGVYQKLPSTAAVFVYEKMIWINLMWGLVNLLPIWPLDGGQIFQVLIARSNPRQGVRQSHIVGLITAGILAVYFLATGSEGLFRPFFFGMLAYINFQVLQSLQYTRSYSSKDDDWWRR